MVKIDVLISKKSEDVAEVYDLECFTDYVKFLHKHYFIKKTYFKNDMVMMETEFGSIIRFTIFSRAGDLLEKFVQHSY